MCESFTANMVRAVVFLLVPKDITVPVKYGSSPFSTHNSTLILPPTSHTRYISTADVIFMVVFLYVWETGCLSVCVGDWLSFCMCGRLVVFLYVWETGIYFSQKQLPREMMSRLVITECAGDVFWRLFLPRQ